MAWVDEKLHTAKLIRALSKEAGEVDEDEDEEGNSDPDEQNSADATPQRATTSSIAAVGSSNPARASFWEDKSDGSPEIPAAGTLVSFDGAGVDAETPGPDSHYTTFGDEDAAGLPLIKDGPLEKVEKIAPGGVRYHRSLAWRSICLSRRPTRGTFACS